MKAAVCNNFGGQLDIEEVQLAEPQKDEVKVKIAATAICHSDIHAMKGDFPGMQPPVLGGHESAGCVEEIGENVNTVTPGDTVVVSLLASCGHCRYCIRGLPHLCEADWSFRHQSRVHNSQGQSISAVGFVGSFAEYVVVHQSQVVPIPKEMPMKRACLLGCGVITGFGGVVNRAKVEPLSSTVIIGCGGVGLNAIQGAAYSGSYPIIAIDVIDAKLQDAICFGATHVINSEKEDPIKSVQELTGGTGADYVFTTVGNSAAIQQAFPICGKRGEVIIIGLPPVQESLSISPWDIVFGEKIITGSFMGTTNLSAEIPKLVTLYQTERFKLDELVSGEYPLEKINDAIAAVEQGLAKRNIITFE